MTVIPASRFLILRFIILIFSSLFLNSCHQFKRIAAETQDNGIAVDSTSRVTNDMNSINGDYSAHLIEDSIKIDGLQSEKTWTQIPWNSMNYTWMGSKPLPEDYQGRFKAAWDQNYLYFLVEIYDDFLNPTLSEGEGNYWKGDYVEIFLDEDRSGGPHKKNHQALAYHITTEGHAIDLDTKGNMIYFDNHVSVSRTHKEKKYLWEMAIKTYDDRYDELSDNNVAVSLEEGKILGFSIAYGDNDGKGVRENFMGSKATHGINNDEGYTNADVFGSLMLVK